MKSLTLITLGLAMLALASAAEARSMLPAAQSYYGLHERHDRAKLRRILGVDPVRTKWCGLFMAAVARRAGRRPPVGFASARAWVRFGARSKLRPGAIAVFRGHVTVVASVRNGRVCGIGGNQSNRVKLTCYRIGAILAVRG